MLNPPVDEMLAAMADALSRTVLPALPPGTARDELQAAIALTRRLARAVPHLGPYLHDDTVDLRDSLTGLWSRLGVDEPTDGPVADALAHARALPAAAPPDTIALTATNLALRRAVAELADTPVADSVDHADSEETDRLLRALLVRLAEREDERLRLSPWTPLR